MLIASHMPSTCGNRRIWAVPDCRHAGTRDSTWSALAKAASDREAIIVDVTFEIAW